jgi:hypothetical protein
MTRKLLKSSFSSNTSLLLFLALDSCYQFIEFRLLLASVPTPYCLELLHYLKLIYTLLPARELKYINQVLDLGPRYLSQALEPERGAIRKNQNLGASN